jgi:cytochrome c peroxidase
MCLSESRATYAARVTWPLRRRSPLPARLIYLTILVMLAAFALAACAAPRVGPSQPDDRAGALTALGQRLLADRRLARDGTLACLDCHKPEHGYADGQPVATADGLNTPTLWGLAERTTFGWFTPEVSTLEDFILRPLANPREMGPLEEATLARLRLDQSLRDAYAAAFPEAREPITWEHTAQALAAAVRAIPAPAGADPQGTPTPAIVRGQTLFAELGCGGCHRGLTLSSESFFNTGVSRDTSRNGGQARVPSLVGLAQTAPYFHDGSAASLEEVVRAYQRGGQAPGPGVNAAVSPFVLTDDEARDLVAFLSSR